MSASHLAPATPRTALAQRHDELKRPRRGAATAELGSLTDHEASAARSSPGWPATSTRMPRRRRLLDGRRRAAARSSRTQLPGVDVLFLDTGYHFAETYATRDEVAREPRRAASSTCCPSTPWPSRTPSSAQDSSPATPPCAARCARSRPLQDAPRRATSCGSPASAATRRPTRTNTPLVTWDERNGLVKVNPVAAWTFDELLDYADDHLVPVNLAAVAAATPRSAASPAPARSAPGDDPRPGRWAGLAKTECGLHV